jgi:hypothetical protein
MTRLLRITTARTSAMNHPGKYDCVSLLATICTILYVLHTVGTQLCSNNWVRNLKEAFHLAFAVAVYQGLVAPATKQRPRTPHYSRSGQGLKTLCGKASTTSTVPRTHRIIRGSRVDQGYIGMQSLLHQASGRRGDIYRGHTRYNLFPLQRLFKPSMITLTGWGHSRDDDVVQFSRIPALPATIIIESSKVRKLPSTCTKVSLSCLRGFIAVFDPSGSSCQRVRSSTE